MQGCVVCAANGEVVEVIGAAEPYGLRLEIGGSEYEARLVESSDRGVAVSSVEGSPAPVIGGDGRFEFEYDGRDIFHVAVLHGREVHVVLVRSYHEAVAAFIRRPPCGNVFT